MFTALKTNVDLIVLIIDHNEIDYNQCATLGHSLKVSHILRDISMIACKIDDRCMDFLIDILSHNISVRKLMLAEN